LPLSAIVIDKRDNVATMVCDLEAGAAINIIMGDETIELLALTDIRSDIKLL